MAFYFICYTKRPRLTNSDVTYRLVDCYVNVSMCAFDFFRSPTLVLSRSTRWYRNVSAWIMWQGTLNIFSTSPPAFSHLPHRLYVDVIARVKCWVRTWGLKWWYGLESPSANSALLFSIVVSVMMIWKLLQLTNL